MPSARLYAVILGLVAIFSSLFLLFAWTRPDYVLYQLIRRRGLSESWFAEHPDPEQLALARLVLARLLPFLLLGLLAVSFGFGATSLWARLSAEGADVRTGTPRGPTPTR